MRIEPKNMEHGIFPKKRSKKYPGFGIGLYQISHHIFTYPLWVGRINKLGRSPLAILSGLFQSAIVIVVPERFHDLAASLFGQSMNSENENQYMDKSTALWQIYLNTFYYSN